ncbi:MAG: tol-pal system YbgF family protein [Saprospiraceae bacterium]
MPASNQSCLSIEDLIAHGEGDLSMDRKAHLKQCELCKAALDGLELADPSIRTALLEGSFMQEFQKVNTAPSTVAKQRKLIPAKWAVAASISLGLGWAAWQYYPPTTGEIFEASPLSYVEQPYRRQMRSAGITTDIYGEAAHAFAIDSFNQSIPLYLAAIPKAPTDLLRTRGFYEIGIAYWKAGAFEEGIDNLTRARLGELDYFEDATWALAQLYRHLGYMEEALSLYQDLLNIEKSPYAEKARQMIDLINSSNLEEQG